MPELDLGNVKGPQGKSAYQSALDAGYSGSEEAFNTAMAKAPDAVLYTAQTLTDAQKAQARGNINAAQSDLNRSITLYVSPNGNDDTGDGSQSKPFRQIQRAVDSLPKNIGASEIKVSVAAGEYGGFSINGFYGSGLSNHYSISIVGESRESTIITGGINVSSCMCYVTIQSCTVKGENSGCNIVALHVSGIYMSDVALVGTTAVFGVWFDACLCAKIYYSEVSNKSKAGILADGTMLYCARVSGTNNAVGIQSGSNNSGSAGVVVGSGCTIDGTSKYNKEIGGIIFMDGVLV